MVERLLSGVVYLWEGLGCTEGILTLESVLGSDLLRLNFIPRMFSFWEHVKEVL